MRQAVPFHPNPNRFWKEIPKIITNKVRWVKIPKVGINIVINRGSRKVFLIEIPEIVIDRKQNVFILASVMDACAKRSFSPSSLLLSSLELSDAQVYEPYIRARLGTAAHLCEVVVPKFILASVMDACAKRPPPSSLLSLQVLAGP